VYILVLLRRCFIVISHLLSRDDLRREAGSRDIVLVGLDCSSGLSVRRHHEKRREEREEEEE
jgi:hypothetical protein